MTPTAAAALALLAGFALGVTVGWLWTAQRIAEERARTRWVARHAGDHRHAGDAIARGIEGER